MEAVRLALLIVAAIGLWALLRSHKRATEFWEGRAEYWEKETRRVERLGKHVVWQGICKKCDGPEYHYNIAETSPGYCPKCTSCPRCAA